MTLNGFLNGLVRYGSFLFNQVLYTSWCLGVISVSIFILLVIVFLKRRRVQVEEIAAYPVQKQETPQKVSEKDKWEKGKIRIKKLLYEMTEDMPGGEILNTDSIRFSNGNRRDSCDISVQKRPQKILKERNIQKSRPNNSDAPLDLQELRDVALLAKNLRSRGRHRIRT